jgi:hypothetical protein
MVGSRAHAAIAAVHISGVPGVKRAAAAAGGAERAQAKVRAARACGARGCAGARQQWARERGAASGKAATRAINSWRCHALRQAPPASKALQPAGRRRHAPQSTRARAAPTCVGAV